MSLTWLVIILIVVLGFNVWNTINLYEIKNRPLRSTELNDKHYWELKYKSQYMITIFAVVVAIITFLGYNSITSIQDDVRASVEGQLYATRLKIDSLQKAQTLIDDKVGHTDSVLGRAENVILGLSDREKLLNGSLSLRNLDLKRLKQRITEINSKNIIQQNVYIVDNVEWSYTEYWDHKKYFFKDFVTNTGQKLPHFKNPPFIFAVSNQGYTFALRRVTDESFEMTVSGAANTDMNDAKSFLVTLFITEKP